MPGPFGLAHLMFGGLKDVGSPNAGSAGRGGGRAGKRKVVVIGENMRQRVIPYAEERGYGYYKPQGRNVPEDLAMRRNKEWIRRQMREEVEIVNIGPDARRRASTGAASPFYEMELKEIRDQGYAFYVEDVQP